MFIRVQNLIKNEDGIIVSGSASVYQSSYAKDAKGGHCKQKTSLSLGKVLWINEKRDLGIFDCKDRGIVEYNLNTNSFSDVELDDPRLNGTKIALQERTHTTFGDAYIFFSLVNKSIVFDSIRESFKEEAKLERVMVHIMYGCIRNHSSAKCGQFLERSMASYLFHRYSSSTLNCDTDYFKYMGDDNVKKTYFTILIKNMRKKYPNFGRACYVDSTPLPTEAEGFPYNALCCHGTDALVMQARLGLVLDIETGIPVWFQVFCSNILDHSTLKDIEADVKITLDMDIDIETLDAGYACKELFEKYNIDNNTYVTPEGETRERYILIRMPQKNGYPHDELYLECKSRLYSALYLFDYDGHAYYGECFERTIFGYREYCYVYLDRKQAENLGGKWRAENPKEWEALCDTDKEWYAVKDGFFILISGKLQTPREALIDYKGRNHIEGFFKDGKSYTDIMPVEKWSKTTVLGKLLHDVIQTTVYRQFRSEMSVLGISVSHFLTELQSLDCMKQSNGQCNVFTPKKQVREYYEKLGYTVPAFMNLGPFREEIMQGNLMDRTPVTITRQRQGKKSPVKHHSPEEKERIKLLEKAIKNAEKVYKQKSDKAEGDYRKALKQADSALEKTLSKALLKRTNSLKCNPCIEEIKQVEDVYSQTVSEAKEVHDKTITEALKIREKTRESVKQEYETTIANIVEQYAPSHQKECNANF